MLICLNRGPKFLRKLIPISKLTSAFLFEQIELTVQAITSIQVDVNAISCDGNQVNQAFCKLIKKQIVNIFQQMNIIKKQMFIIFS